MQARVPPYFDWLIADFHRGAGNRFVHLGYWESPPAEGAATTADEFGRAQKRLNDELVCLAGPANGQAVLDVGCGFGGTLDGINAQFAAMQLTGVNIDPRQLAICSGLEARNRNSLRWEEADACALPFAEGSFDRVFCIEAMFHFSSRRAFFDEAARVLRPGGAMVCSDITIDATARRLDTPAFDIKAALQNGYGPWPDLWSADADHAGIAAEAGLRLDQSRDISANVLPSHDFTTPTDAGDWIVSDNAALRAAMMLKWLHVEGLLRYQCFRFVKPAG